MTRGRMAISLAAVALAALAAWGLATFEGSGGVEVADGAGHDAIDDASRAELSRVLREARDAR